MVSSLRFNLIFLPEIALYRTFSSPLSEKEEEEEDDVDGDDERRDDAEVLPFPKNLESWTGDPSRLFDASDFCFSLCDRCL